MNKAYTMYAGLAVMLMQKYRNVLPIKYIYRRSQADGFAFEPVSRGAIDKKYIKSYVYPEIIYNSDRTTNGPRQYKIDIGKIPQTWKRQKKKSRLTGEELWYNRGGHSDNAVGGKNWYSRFQYRDYSFQASRVAGANVKTSSVGYEKQKYVNVVPKSPQDYIQGIGSHSPKSDPKYNEFAAGMRTGGIGGRRKTSDAQITPQGMKARWIRGGGPGGGQHLQNLLTPRKTRMQTPNVKGEAGRLGGQHIMRHWFKLWEANYNLILKSESGRVLRSFIREVYPEHDKNYRINQPKVTQTRTTTIKRSRGRPKGSGGRTYSTKYHMSKHIRKFGILGPGLTIDKFQQVLKDVPLHYIGSEKTISAWDAEFFDLTDDKMAAKDFTDAVRKLQRKINSTKGARKKFPKKMELIGMPIKSNHFSGLVMVARPGKGDNAPVQMSAFIVPTGKKEYTQIADSLIKKKSKNAGTRAQSTLQKRGTSKKASVEIITQESSTIYGMIARNATTISLEDDDGVALGLGKHAASTIFRRVNKQIRTKRKFMEAGLSGAFDPEDYAEGGFKNWYKYWLRQCQRLETQTVGSHRAGWKKFMLQSVGKQPDPKRKGKRGNINDYIQAAKVWHPPGYIRPFIRMGEGTTAKYNRP